MCVSVHISKHIDRDIRIHRYIFILYLLMLLGILSGGGFGVTLLNEFSEGFIYDYGAHSTC